MADSSVNIYDTSIVDENRRCSSCLDNDKWSSVWSIKDEKCRDDDNSQSDDLVRQSNECPITSQVNVRFALDRPISAKINIANINKLMVLGDDLTKKCIFYNQNYQYLDDSEAIYSDSDFKELQCGQVDLSSKVGTIWSSDLIENDTDNYDVQVFVQLQVGRYKLDSKLNEDTINVYNCGHGEGNTHCTLCQSRKGKD